MGSFDDWIRRVISSIYSFVCPILWGPRWAAQLLPPAVDLARYVNLKIEGSIWNPNYQVGSFRLGWIIPKLPLYNLLYTMIMCMSVCAKEWIFSEYKQLEISYLSWRMIYPNHQSSKQIVLSSTWFILIENNHGNMSL